MDWNKYAAFEDELEDKPQASEFDFSKDKMSEYKIICILPDGERLCYRYNKKDNLSRFKNPYDHAHYLAVALKDIANKMDNKKGEDDYKDYIENNFVAFNIDASNFIYHFLNDLGVSILYEIGYNEKGDGRYLNFDKSYIFTKEQMNSVSELREALEKENYEIATVQFVANDINNMKKFNKKIFGTADAMFYIGANINPTIIGREEEQTPIRLSEFYDEILPGLVSQPTQDSNYRSFEGWVDERF